MAAMADVSYAPGTLTAVTGDRCWVLIDATPDSPAVTWLWQQLGQRMRPEAILAGLLGAGFAGATEFTLLYQEDTDAYRLFCRGTVAATVQDIEPAHGGVAGGTAEVRRIDGSGLLTWREHTVPRTARRIVLGEPPAGGAPWLPATAGVLLASCVIIDLAGAVMRDSVPYDPPPAVMRTVTEPGPLVDAIPHADGATSPGMPPPARVIRPDTLADGPRAVGQAESADYPDTVTMTGPPSVADGTGSPSAASPLPALAGGPPPAAAEEYDFLWGATQNAVGRGRGDQGGSGGRRPPARIPRIRRVQRHEWDRNGRERTAFAPASGVVTAASTRRADRRHALGTGPGRTGRDRRDRVHGQARRSASDGRVGGTAP